MVDDFDGNRLCREIAKPYKQGCLQVDSNTVTWKVFVANGHLQYATNSLQNFETLTYQLTQAGYTVSSTILEAVRLGLNATSASDPLGALLYDAVDQLRHQRVLDTKAANVVKLALSKDALESLLWLTQARHTWIQQDSHHIALASLNDVIDQLEERSRTWQKLTPVITSPYERPQCLDTTKLTQSVPQGMLNQSLLKMLAQLMKGNSIRQISLFLKQDDLKVAHLLHPYIQHGVFTLNAPTVSFAKLPRISTTSLSTAGSQHKGLTKPARQVSKKIYKIVCIDDSPAMLETIQGYLGSEGFEVATVENPMESMSTLFSMKPDLILMDVSMPGINGNRLCEILRRSAAFKKLPIIMVSGNTSVLDKAKSESSGATDYLTKPFSKADLLTLVDSYLSVTASA